MRVMAFKIMRKYRDDVRRTTTDRHRPWHGRPDHDQQRRLHAAASFRSDLACRWRPPAVWADTEPCERFATLHIYGDPLDRPRAGIWIPENAMQPAARLLLVNRHADSKEKTPTTSARWTRFI